MCDQIRGDLALTNHCTDPSNIYTRKYQATIAIFDAKLTPPESVLIPPELVFTPSELVLTLPSKYEATLTYYIPCYLPKNQRHSTTVALHL